MSKKLKQSISVGQPSVESDVSEVIPEVVNELPVEDNLSVIGIEALLNKKLNVYLQPSVKAKLVDYVVNDPIKAEKAVKYANVLSQQDLNRYLDLNLI